MKDFLKRSAWIFLAVLFLVTGLGVGVVAFWQATHPADSKTSQNSSANATAPTCTNDPSIQFNTEASGKLANGQLASFTPIAKAATLSCIDVKVGTGQVIQSSSSITANYTGALAATGVIFQSSLDNGQSFSTTLNNVIPGWQQGLLGMKAGGERRLIIPASLAYGSQAQTGIPANSDLVFDISVDAVQ